MFRSSLSVGRSSLRFRSSLHTFTPVVRVVLHLKKKFLILRPSVALFYLIFFKTPSSFLAVAKFTSLRRIFFSWRPSVALFLMSSSRFTLTQTALRRKSYVLLLCGFRSDRKHRHPFATPFHCGRSLGVFISNFQADYTVCHSIAIGLTAHCSLLHLYI